jgi:hypothetical protein
LVSESASVSALVSVLESEWALVSVLESASVSAWAKGYAARGNRKVVDRETIVSTSGVNVSPSNPKTRACRNV